ncbi:S-adenosylmethionine:tRNA ribosyltransferase-isomerase [Hymenobacter perfusus]|uniref:S-adenosylmethionine:tRNA ribosyltransferase-isomerase n=1 Tax=Hymenobacter perfusus TaxID=1236770 RepID=A0A428JXP5_9BACT|nr:S-adenosylmethionine:tRNA ribosyltransferase-isomerase [Hymenobacter perfusus]RSK38917.1 S-adenosylmethionine:tRNA ribosyltransferase-isomerase [Hymenobacter perfusus]
MNIEEFRYTLAPENLEGTPREIRLGRRDLSRLLVVDRTSGALTHSTVFDLPKWLAPGDVLVLNNSKRIPGVLKGFTAVGGQVELRFVDLDSDNTGLCRIFPMHDVRPGERIELRRGGSVEVLATELTKYKLARVRPENDSLRELLKSQGIPILGFFYEGIWTAEHLNPYFATEEGSVESPLAGLHFTPELVESLKQHGVHVCFVTLHSVGSWLPFLESKVEEHEMWAESFCVPKETVNVVLNARKHGNKVVACGSTSLRALESAVGDDGQLTATSGRSKLYITPGYKFHVVDAYFTNFHQYQNSLIVLDAAFAGMENAMHTYREASSLHYSFYEFGDAVLYL